MNSFNIKVDPRDAQYGRFASMVLRTLKRAVNHRLSPDCKQADIAGRLGWHPSQLSRVLNGRVNNISIKTVSDILWACDFEPEEFSADPIEEISPNHHCFFQPQLVHPVPTGNNVFMFEMLSDGGSRSHGAMTFASASAS